MTRSPDRPDAGLPAFHEVHRSRPVDLVASGTATDLAPGAEAPLGRPAPYAGVVGELAPQAARASLRIASGPTTLEVVTDGGRLGLRVDDGTGAASEHRSRRFGRTGPDADAVALTLTGLHLTAYAREAGTWRARGRVDLTGRIDTRDEAWLGAARVRGDGDLAAVRHGAFGQLGLRDLRLVTEADGRPVREGDDLWLSATSAGPGFFDTAHTSVWRWSAATYELTHTADLYFRRPDVPGVFGDHATHVLRDGERWLVATSTWGDFVEPSGRAQRRRPSGLRAVLARTGADPRTGQHVLDTEELPLPDDGVASVGRWDPHLVRRGDEWWVGYVSAERFFRFHPSLASGPSLDQLTLRGASTARTATEGTTLLPVGDDLVVVASDGRDSPAALRAGYPVFDDAMRETGRLRAPYPTNIPWPTLAPPAAPGGAWHLVTFNGRGRDGDLLGYGTHGDVVVLRGAAAD